MERVSLITGKMPVIFLCPHGGDRPALVALTEYAAALSQGNAVINQGFKRGPKINYTAEIADCNRIDHCLMETVVFEEFMRPVINLKEKLKKHNNRVDVFVLTDLPKPGPTDMDLLIGYGNGTDLTATCPLWAFELYATSLKYVQITPWMAKATGTFTASDPTVMNQLFKVYDYDKEVFSMHLWINEPLLRRPKSAASGIADAAVEMTKHKSYNSKIVRLPLY